MTSSSAEDANYVGSVGRAASLRRTRHRRLALAAALGAAAAGGLAGTLAAGADLAWWLELFVHFRPQYAALLAVAGLVLLALGRRALGLAALLLGAVNASALAHYYWPRPAPPPAGTELRAALANVWFRNQDPGPLLAWLRRAQPDVAVLLEATPAWRAAIGTLTDLLPHQARAGDVVVASRLPLGDLQALPFGDGGEAAVAFSVGLGDGAIRVIGVHVDWPLGPASAARRNAQLEVLARLARASPAPVLLLGDLNVTAFSPHFDRLLIAGGLKDCAAGRGFSPSWPTVFPPLSLRIDHCLHGPGLVPYRVTNGPRIGSDHFPLEVTVIRTDPGHAAPVPAGGAAGVSRFDPVPRERAAVPAPLTSRP